MTRTKGRVKIPVNITGRLNQAMMVFEKHKAEAGNSPLKLLEGYDWDVLDAAIKKAADLHREAEELKAKMESAYRERDTLLPTIDAALLAAKGVLKAKYVKNPKALGDWGFNVDDSPQNRAATAKT